MRTCFVVPRHRSHSPDEGLQNSTHALRFECFRRAPSVITVDVYGDIDGSNADELTRYLARVRRPSDDVVLDLSGVTFFGTHGLSALLHTNAAGVVVVPSPVVRRLLQLCDSGSRVPVAADVDSAMAVVTTRRCG